LVRRGGAAHACARAWGLRRLACRRLAHLLVVALGVVVLGCVAPVGPGWLGGRPAGGAALTPPAAEEPLLVLAAADLQYALPEIAAAYEATSGRKTVLTFGSTGAFSAQIENGAPADVFFAANESFIDALVAKGLLRGETRQLYAVGRIVLTSASSAPVQARTLEDLRRAEIRTVAIANPEHAPYGLAAQQALQAAGLWTAIEPKLVLGENIAQTFQFVQTGNADAGIVALSIVLGVPGTAYTLIDDSLHAPIAQAAAVLTSSKQPETAQAFLAFVNGEPGRPIMKRYGFVLPGELD
jgi:molybdate transport system substrate-binding protein